MDGQRNNSRIIAIIIRMPVIVITVIRMIMQKWVLAGISYCLV